MRLSKLNIGKSARVIRIEDDIFRTKLMEMGVSTDTILTVRFKAPFRGPIAFSYSETILSIRYEDAEAIIVEPETRSA